MSSTGLRKVWYLTNERAGWFNARVTFDMLRRHVSENFWLAGIVLHDVESLHSRRQPETVVVDLRFDSKTLLPVAIELMRRGWDVVLLAALPLEDLATMNRRVAARTEGQVTPIGWCFVVGRLLYCIPERRSFGERKLSQLQVHVMALTSHGIAPVEIAKVLGRTPATVKTNLRKLATEFGVATPEEATQHGRQIGAFDSLLS